MRLDHSKITLCLFFNLLIKFVGQSNITVANSRQKDSQTLVLQPFCELVIVTLSNLWR